MQIGSGRPASPQNDLTGCKLYVNHREKKQKLSSIQPPPPASGAHLHAALFSAVGSPRGEQPVEPESFAPPPQRARQRVAHSRAVNCVCSSLARQFFKSWETHETPDLHYSSHNAMSTMLFLTPTVCLCPVILSSFIPSGKSLQIYSLVKKLKRINDLFNSRFCSF